MHRAIVAWISCLFLCLVVRAADSRPFSQTLSPAEKQRLGLGNLTAAQLADLDAAIGSYTRGEATVAVQHAVQAVEQKSAEKVHEAEKKAAESAVADYKKKEEPGVIARTLEVFKRDHTNDPSEKFTARVVGRFRGWSGGTYFPLDNGQVWRQAGSETNELPPVSDAEVEIYRSSNGYWRLKYAGAWITVKRLQ